MFASRTLSFRRWFTAAALLGAAAMAPPASANDYPLPAANSRLIGKNLFHQVENDGGSLEAIAKKYNVGFLALLPGQPGRGSLCAPRRERADHPAPDAAAGRPTRGHRD